MINKILDWFAGRQHHKVTFFATGVMGNQYKVGTFEATSDRKWRDMFGGNIANFVFYKHEDVLSKHYKETSIGINYRSITHE